MEISSSVPAGILQEFVMGIPQETLSGDSFRMCFWGFHRELYLPINPEMQFRDSFVNSLRGFLHKFLQEIPADILSMDFFNKSFCESLEELHLSITPGMPSGNSFLSTYWNPPAIRYGDSSRNFLQRIPPETLSEESFRKCF